MFSIVPLNISKPSNSYFMSTQGYKYVIYGGSASTGPGPCHAAVMLQIKTKHLSSKRRSAKFSTY